MQKLYIKKIKLPKGTKRITDIIRKQDEALILLEKKKTHKKSVKDFKKGA